MVKSELRLLHIIMDEKFPDAAYRQFEVAAPGASTYLLPDKKNKIKYLQDIVPVRVSQLSFLSKRFIKSLEQYDAVIIHGMTNFSLEVIARTSPKVKFIWIGMGFDYYDLLYQNVTEMLEADTAKIVAELTQDLHKKTFKKKVKVALKHFIYPNATKKKALIERISIFSPVIYSEYKAIQKCSDTFDADYMKWNYGAQSELIDSKIEYGLVEGSSILIGNSASPNNNHIEVFHILQRMSLPSEARIVVPLSYGDPIYREYIIREGKRIFGDRFQPITNFLDFKSYVNILKTCSVVIMNHKRQQGAGNIGIALFLGAKIFMNPENLLLREYLDQGLTVFQIKDLKRELNSGISGLNQEAAVFHRDYLKKEKGFNNHVENTQALIERIIEFRPSKT